MKDNARLPVYTLTSPLHDSRSVDVESAAFLQSLESFMDFRFDVRGEDFSDYGSSPISLIFVRTGGTEGLFKAVFDSLGDAPVRLLASGRNNSLAAAMEILSFLRMHGRDGEILHGDPESVAGRITLLACVESARRTLSESRYGVIGRPSDWLVASVADRGAVQEALGVALVDIGMDELLEEISMKEYPSGAQSGILPLSLAGTGAVGKEQFEGALQIYGALRRLVARHGLSGFTLRCFDLLDSVGNTGCLGLAMLNSEGLVAGCEGDVPAMLTMAISRALTGSSGFQCNPSRIDTRSGSIVLAHCTVPLDMLRSYTYDTHFESGIGVAVRGEMQEGDVTVFKVSGDLSRYYVDEAVLVENLCEKDLCRTQLMLRTGSSLDYFLKSPLGNHHVVLKGRHASLISAFMDSAGALRHPE